MDSNVIGSKRLIASILLRAIEDAKLYKMPLSPSRRRLVKNKKRTEDEMLAWEARQFLYATNKVFSFYATSLSLDPIYLAKSIQRSIWKFDHTK
jgi:hypothetical protein